MPSYGGQALIEGVLMRGKRFVSAAMRAPDGQIVIHSEPLDALYQSNWMKLPFLRGVIGLWDALGLGMRFLTLSANTQSPDEKIEGGSMVLTLGLSLLIAAAVFFAAPAFLASLAEQYLHFSSLAGNLLEGVIRLSAAIGYIWAVGKMPEIARVFQYHGAEHKTINAFEDGAELNPETVMGYSLEHPRCGTAFLLTLLVFSIIFFALIGPLPGAWRILSRILFIPVLAGLAYEFIRYTANHIDSPIIRLLIKPNLALQSMTTREPDLSMVEVAITAFKTMKEKEEAF
jgi:uncharacterized protein YqhQ